MNNQINHSIHSANLVEPPEVSRMIVNSTDFINDPEKYLRLSAKEEIIITSNGIKIAKLCALAKTESATVEEGQVMEQARLYETAPRHASYEEYLKLTESSDERYEYIDGEIYLLASPKVTHQKTLGQLYLIFHAWFQGKRCEPMLAPFDITLKRSTDDINVVQPDLMVICDLEDHLNERDYYMGVPTLVVEIISESTRSKDFIKKLGLYMSTGVREYWIVNPLNREVSIYQFESNNISKNSTYKQSETAASFTFTGFEVSLGEIFA